jgi:MFS family permease
MLIQKIRQSLNTTYHEYPRTFWSLVGVSFVDSLGGFILFPFFALYLTKRFSVGMTEVGVLFGFFSISSFVGSTLGGALADRMGRKGIAIFSMVANSLAAVLMGLVNSMQAFFVLALLVGVFTDMGGPARQAMIADLLPDEQRGSGFGILRVAANLAAAIGPAIGGFIAGHSYLALFLADAAISLVVAGLFYVAIPETRPAPHPDAVHETMAQTFQGYGRVLRDGRFMAFTLACMLMVFTYQNMNTTMGVYLRDTHHIAEAGYGFIISLNAALVVLLQFWITRRIAKYPPMLVMGLGALLYAVGFALYGVVSTYLLFAAAMVIITFGEMIAIPTSQTVTARLAPENMRGRYMAIFGYSWGIPFALGPYLAGLIMDNADPRLLWYAAGVVGLLATAGFGMLHRAVDDAARAAVEAPTAAN